MTKGVVSVCVLGLFVSAKNVGSSLYLDLAAISKVIYKFVST